MAKHEYLSDVESYWNYFLVALEDTETGEQYEYSMFGRKATLSKEDRRELRRLLTRHRFITFNGNNYDILMIVAATLGWTCEDLKKLTNYIIDDDAKPWEVTREYQFKIPEIDHIDLIEVAPGSASLKIYNGRVHGKKLRDLPYEPATILTRKQADNVCDYCFIDLDATRNVFKALSGELDLRRSLTREHGIDLRSKSDAQVAEAIIRKEIRRLTGKCEKANMRDWVTGTQFYYKIPSFIKFKTKNMQNVLDLIRKTPFTIGKNGYVNLPEVLSEEKIRIGDAYYTMGIGGLHSNEKSISHEAGNSYFLRDSDVTSYYPRIIINQGLYPKHLGPAFKKVFKKIVDDRVYAKGQAQKIEDELPRVNDPDRIEEMKAALRKWKIAADGGKIMVNGSFGKFGSSFSILYSPTLLIQTTITGQLSLMMLIEALVQEGFEVISANTDGIITKIPVWREAEYKEILDWWQEVTSFQMEYTDYSGVYSRDVNSYFALYANGKKVKSKGAFSLGTLQINPECEICIDAVINYVRDGKPIINTIKECKDIRKFISLRTVNGGAIWPVEYLKGDGFKHQPAILDGEFLGKSIRWYYAKGVDWSIHYRKPTKSGTHNKVPKTDGARPCMDLPDQLPDDIDYTRYMRMAFKLLESVGYEENPYGKLRTK